MLRRQKASEPAENSFLERLAQRIGVAADAKRIYGEPVERGGVTVIPVAKAVYAFGGGSGERENEQGTGSGGGGAMVLKPVGYIEIKRGVTRFRPTRNPLVYGSLIAAFAPLAVFAVWSLTKALRKENAKEKSDAGTK